MKTEKLKEYLNQYDFNLDEVGCNDIISIVLSENNLISVDELNELMNEHDRLDRTRYNIASWAFTEIRNFINSKQ